MVTSFRKDDWWFKFKYAKWDDPELVLCDLETQGFWLRVYLHLRRQGTATIKATVEDLAKVVRGTEAEVRRSILDLRQHKAADVTLRNAQNVTSNTLVTLTSRSLIKELSGKEKTKLRVRKHRDKVNVTPDVTAQSKSNKKEVRKEKSNTTLSVDLSGPDESAAVATAQQPATPPRPEPKTLPVEIFIGLVASGMLRRMGLKSFTPADRSEWEKFCRWAFANNFTADDVLECYDLLKQQTWRDSAITTKTLAKELPNLNDLRHPKQNHGTNSTNGGGRYPAKRTDQDVIDESRDFIRKKFNLEP